MASNQNKPSENSKEEKLPEANTGNASNPSPHDKSMDKPGGHQLLDKKAETYLRESGNIEDVPDPQDQLDADETIGSNDNDQA